MQGWSLAYRLLPEQQEIRQQKKSTSRTSDGIEQERETMLGFLRKKILHLGQNQTPTDVGGKWILTLF